MFASMTDSSVWHLDSGSLEANQLVRDANNIEQQYKEARNDWLDGVAPQRIFYRRKFVPKSAQFNTPPHGRELESPTQNRPSSFTGLRWHLVVVPRSLLVSVLEVLLLAGPTCTPSTLHSQRRPSRLRVLINLDGTDGDGNESAMARLIRRNRTYCRKGCAFGCLADRSVLQGLRQRSREYWTGEPLWFVAPCYVAARKWAIYDVVERNRMW